MLFLLNKASANSLEDITLFAGDEDKFVLLTSDAVFLASEKNISRMLDAGVEEIYVDEEAAKARGFEPADDAELVDFAAMADLIMAEHEKTICL